MIRGVNAVSIKIPASYFVDINKPILRFTWKRTQNSQLNTEEEQSQRTGTTGPQRLPESTGIKIIWYWQHKKINRAEKSPEIDPHKYGKLILDKRAKAIQ